MRGGESSCGPTYPTLVYFSVDKKSYKIETKNNQTFVSINHNNQDFEKNNVNKYYRLDSKQPLIDFLLNLGVDIPHYCYHQTLSISGNCRMCLVELKGSMKPIVSCSMGAKGSLVTKYTVIYKQSFS